MRIKNYLLFIYLSVSYSFISQIYHENFDQIIDWAVVDSDGDGVNWSQIGPAELVGSPLESFGNAMFSPSVNTLNGTQLTPDNFMFNTSPIVKGNNPGLTYLMFDAGILSLTGGEQENYSIYYSSDVPTNLPNEMISNLGTVYPLLATGTVSTPNMISTIYYNVDAIPYDEFYLIFRHNNATTLSTLFIDNVMLVNSHFTSSNNVGCAASNLSFNNTAVGKSPELNMFFTFQDGNPSTSDQNTVVVNFGNGTGMKTITQYVKNVPLYSYQVEIVDTPTPNFDTDVSTGCSPLRVTFYVNDGNGYEFTFSDSTKMTIQTGDSLTKTFSDAGIYNVMLTQTIDAQCVGSTIVNNLIHVLPTPDAKFTPTESKLDMLYPTVSFFNESIGAVSYEWDFGDTAVNEYTLSPTHVYPEGVEANYDVKLIATSADGCVDSITSRIIVEEKIMYFIPNTFTPNGDEFNNTFKPMMITGVDSRNYNLKIFNRWGTLIFESNDPNYGWDGDYGAGTGITDAQVYTYKLQFLSSKNDEVRTVVGSVTLLK
ncbi:MAG: gliding motility-associated C-terminal domain-containing protein [Flavobacteriia bacterium]|nr:gliding motility-associated C-terminal domain-containing protein [Flavobacteriia bacterium]